MAHEEVPHLGTRGGAASRDSVLLVGPPRMGKVLHVVIPWVLDAPGHVVVTSTRPDTLAVTYHARARRGPVAIVDPQPGLPPRVAMVAGAAARRPAPRWSAPAAWAAGAGWGHGVSDADFLGRPDRGRAALPPARRRPRRPARLAALADPYVLAAVDPGPGEAFDPATFLHDNGTLFLLASPVTSGSCAPLVAAFDEDITETARAVTARAAGARLDPPLLLALDEIANLTPLPSLPSLMAEGGGTGITTLAVL